MGFLSYLISGLGLGSVYAIIALGYTMVYGIAKMLNFAHGDVIMIGAYVSFSRLTALACLCRSLSFWQSRFAQCLVS
jgi:branched-chain amino acid transport system permease protein